MKCPNCNSSITLRKGEYEKIDFFRHKFKCGDCKHELANNVAGETIQALGFILLSFGILSFGGSWPIPLLASTTSNHYCSRRVNSTYCRYENGFRCS